MIEFLFASSLIFRTHDSGKGWDYPWECCSDRDCWQTGDRSEPDPVHVWEGWRLWDGRVVLHDQVRPSPDGNFHVCRKMASPDGEVVVPYNGTKWCLWVPIEG